MRDTTSERVWSDELPSFLSSSSATSSLKDEQHEDVKILGGNWKKGDACEVAHGVFEYWLHPGRYRTQPCKDGPRTPGSVESYDGSPLRLAMEGSCAKGLTFMSSPDWNRVFGSGLVLH
ncbi:hypothetical protein CsSME_00029625 [Camellia sinensis var. sinensis]